MIDLLVVCDVSNRDVSASCRCLYLTERHVPPSVPRCEDFFFVCLFVFSESLFPFSSSSSESHLHLIN